MDFGSYRYTRAEVDLNKLASNYHTMRKKLSSSTKFMGVVKADAYGHGAVEVSKQLEKEGIDYLAIAALDEAIEIRNAGVSTPILLFSPIEPDTIPVAIKNNISLTIFSEENAKAVKEYAEIMEQHVSIHLKIDSGMGRIGARTKEEALHLSQILRSDYIQFDGIYTHFAESENIDNPQFTKDQYDFFIDSVNYLEEKNITFSLRHCCNTAATLLYPEFHLDMIRTGISLVGYHPAEALEYTVDLDPIMKVVTHAAHIKEVEKGTPISYGRTYTAERDEKIATVLLGYADGIPRELSNQWYLSTEDNKVPIAGMVCMDQLMVDVTDIDQFTVEDELVFIGDPKKDYPSIYAMAELTNSFHYEILCGIGKRIPRVYFKDSKIEARSNALLS